MDCGTPGFRVLHHLPQLAQTHVHWVNDAIQSFHPLSPPSPFWSQSFPASGSFPMNQLLASHGPSVRASASVLPMIIQGWFPLGLTGLISLQFKGFSRVFSSTTVWKHQFFSAQPSLWSNSHSFYHYRAWTISSIWILLHWVGSLQSPVFFWVLLPCSYFFSDSGVFLFLLSPRGILIVSVDLLGGQGVAWVWGDRSLQNHHMAPTWFPPLLHRLTLVASP